MSVFAIRQVRVYDTISIHDHQPLSPRPLSQYGAQRRSLHSLAVPFPIMGLVGAFLTDLAFILTGQTYWAVASHWLLGMGIGTGIAAAVFGVIDYANLDRVRTRTGWVHALGNVVALALSLLNLVVRLEVAVPTVTIGQFALSAIVVLVVAVSGWMGVEMAFRRQMRIMQGMGLMYPDHLNR